MNKKDSYHSHASQQERVNTVQNHRQMLKKQIQKMDNRGFG